MAALLGNQTWKARSTHGRQNKFTPETLWSAAVEYFEWVESTPLIEDKSTQFQGEQVRVTNEKMRAMTLDGLTIFLDITDETWRNYKKREDYFRVCESISKIIRSQKLEGAAAGLFNASIIQRDIGLRELTETAHTGVVGVSDLTDLSAEDLNNRILDLQRLHEDSLRLPA